MIKNMGAFNRSKPANFDGVFDWDFLKEGGAFGNTRIEPFDFDGVVERNGYFLVYETKDEGKEIPLGQKIALESAVKTGFFIVFVIWGKTDCGRLEIWSRDSETGKVKYKKMDESSREIVLEYTSRWYEWVDGLEKPVYDYQLKSEIEKLKDELDRLREAAKQKPETMPPPNYITIKYTSRRRKNQDDRQMVLHGPQPPMQMRISACRKQLKFMADSK